MEHAAIDPSREASPPSLSSRSSQIDFIGEWEWVDLTRISRSMRSSGERIISLDHGRTEIIAALDYLRTGV